MAWPVRIITLIIIIVVFRSLGLRGIIGLIMGMSIMAWLMLSMNPVLFWLVGLLGDKDKAAAISKMWREK